MTRRRTRPKTRTNRSRATRGPASRTVPSLLASLSAELAKLALSPVPACSTPARVLLANHLTQLGSPPSAGALVNLAGRVFAARCAAYPHGSGWAAAHVTARRLATEAVRLHQQRVAAALGDACTAADATPAADAACAERQP